MTDTQIRFQQAFDELSTVPPQDKMLFLELLLFKFTISARGIWSDEQSSEKDKVEAFKWLNELNHRIWNIWFELKEGKDSDSMMRLYGNMKVCGEQSAHLHQHLMPTLLSAFELFKNISGSK